MALSWSRWLKYLVAAVGILGSPSFLPPMYLSISSVVGFLPDLTLSSWELGVVCAPCFSKKCALGNACSISFKRLYAFASASSSILACRCARVSCGKAGSPWLTLSVGFGALVLGLHPPAPGHEFKPSGSTHPVGLGTYW